MILYTGNLFEEDKNHEFCVTGCLIHNYIFPEGLKFIQKTQLIYEYIRHLY